MVAQSIAHYRILAKIGAGGMGEVYRAQDTRLRRDVAPKVLPEAFARDAGRMARFASDYPGAVIDRLGINYRSSQEVIATFSAIAPHMAASQGMLPLALEADKGSSGICPQLRRFDTLDDEAAGIAARVRGRRRR